MITAPVLNFSKQGHQKKPLAKLRMQFSLIGDSTRLKILWLLCHSEECVINIAAAIDMSSPAVSHHLKVLKQAGVITSKRVGKEAYYTLADTEEAEIIHNAIDKILDIKCSK